MQATKGNKILNFICRWFVGLVFIFSGFVKAVDPLGTAFKISEYMTAWSIGNFTFDWALPLATPLSVALVTIEFTIGILLITNSLRQLHAWVLLLMMIFFTGSTLIDAITNKVTDCGCFGDAIKLTNWQTFGKNIILLIPTIIIFIQRKMTHKRKLERESLVAIITAACVVIFALWNINNEPCIDFRAWKVGNQMMPFGEELQVKSFVTYKNKATNKITEFESKYLMDSMKVEGWTDNWEFVDSRVEDPYEIAADGFAMLGPDADDYAKDIIGNPGYVLIGTIHHLDKVNKEGINALIQTHNFCVENGINFVLLTSALDEDVQAFLFENKLEELIYYFADATAIETMLRSNPGFILLKDAKVMGKWHYRNARKIQSFDFTIDE